MSLVDQTAEFFANLVGYGHSPGSTISAVLGACLSGLTCGALGSFIIMRRMSLFADMLGHAVLPGVAIGFILAGSKSTPALLLGSDLTYLPAVMEPLASTLAQLAGPSTIAWMMQPSAHMSDFSLYGRSSTSSGER